ncbi:SDR family NAD(P)-dependent oxidoreductase [Nocardia sp. NPDC006044]|uniref:SDR family NAD(P)-dependent oxidoreductase n=1 Tax=Nocardia sp. NPDC006044 TaxID=3364306 RepID=UPI0036D12821
MNPTGPLAGKTALITGADTGIGKSIAKTLAGQGAQVVIQHPHSPESAADVVKEITNAGGSALALAADIGDRDEYAELVQALLEECGHWDALVHTGGGAITTPLREISAEEFDLGFAAPAKAVFNGIQLAAVHLADGGRIITVGAPAAPGNAVDNAATAAIAEFTRSLAPDFTERRIAVNAVSPGAAGADNGGPAKGEHEPSYVMGTGISERLGAATELTDAVAFLVSDEAESVTAQHIRVKAATA